VSGTSRSAHQASTASATNPCDHARRAAAICASRLGPAAAAAAMIRRYVAATPGCGCRLPGAGGFPPGSQTSAEVGQSVVNISATPATVSVVSGPTG
jgi:hypothetical protein